MPLSGTLDVAPRVADAPLVTSLATEPVVLERAEILYAMFEIDAGEMENLVPAALNPTIPPVVLCCVMGSPFQSGSCLLGLPEPRPGDSGQRAAWQRAYF